MRLRSGRSKSLSFAAAVAAVLIVVPTARRARANDSEAVLAGGILTLKKSDGIVMESEELLVTPHKVRVAYVFRNATAADISTRVAFPLAPYEYDESLDEEEMAAARKQSWNDFGQFSVTVDGKPVRFESVADVKRETVAVTHHWPQVFPAGKAVSVKHEFTPRGGFIYSFGSGRNERNDDRLKKLASEYCVGPTLMRAMQKKAIEGSVSEVQYILKTGANWKGPIGRFVLRLRKDDATDKVSLCMDGFRKEDARNFVLDKTNFVPTADLRVVFIPM